MNKGNSNLQLAERGAIISILSYLILSAAKLATGHLLKDRKSTRLNSSH